MYVFFSFYVGFDSVSSRLLCCSVIFFLRVSTIRLSEPAVQPSLFLVTMVLLSDASSAVPCYCYVLLRLHSDVDAFSVMLVRAAYG